MCILNLFRYSFSYFESWRYIYSLKAYDFFQYCYIIVNCHIIVLNNIVEIDFLLLNGIFITIEVLLKTFSMYSFGNNMKYVSHRLE